MAQALFNSYEAIHDKIKTSGSVWVKSPQSSYQILRGIPAKWYKTHNKEIVKDHLNTLKEAMARTINSPSLSHSSFKEPVYVPPAVS